MLAEDLDILVAHLEHWTGGNLGCLKLTTNTLANASEASESRKRLAKHIIMLLSSTLRDAHIAEGSGMTRSHASCAVACNFSGRGYSPRGSRLLPR